jgi:hypothetical protein
MRLRQHLFDIVEVVRKRHSLEPLGMTSSVNAASKRSQSTQQSARVFFMLQDVCGAQGRDKPQARTYCNPCQFLGGRGAVPSTVPSVS